MKGRYVKEVCVKCQNRNNMWEKLGKIWLEKGIITCPDGVIVDFGKWGDKEGEMRDGCSFEVEHKMCG